MNDGIINNNEPIIEQTDSYSIVGSIINNNEPIIEHIDSYSICGICLQNLTISDIYTTTCEHNFHHACFNEFMEFNNSYNNILCPLCRNQLLNTRYNYNNNHILDIPNVDNNNQIQTQNTIIRIVANANNSNYSNNTNNCICILGLILFAIYVCFVLSQLIFGIIFITIQTENKDVMSDIFRNIIIISSEFIITLFVEIISFKKDAFISSMAIYVFFGFSRFPLAIQGLYLILYYENFMDLSIYCMTCFLSTIFEYMIVIIFAFYYRYKK